MHHPPQPIHYLFITDIADTDMNHTLRPYKNTDQNAVLDTWEEATRLAHPFMSDAFIAQGIQDIVNIYLPNTETWVAEVDGEVQGFIALMGNEVGAIFLRPSLHGKGIGKALMDKAQALRGNLELEVFKANTIGRAFYERYGFKPQEETLHEPTGQPLLRLKFSATPNVKTA
jgi:putative acetyltransferase